ncbi:T9SS-dependent M36 family metallopeptidase [Flavobacterium frigoris]|uniref:Por secretion system C-terminal sorting domain-containing protein n=1 Tax=Flavobacterium frigoris TaxID=229204 RepID=A0A1H9GG24_FLAFI|nr:T9SS-dependent M36 family metallopeptidase [Flavobacterium frigoris]SEQ49007.1 Por secretion system C-terminal sorting domain-containing protein [Flavobacterium frigoris]
MKKFTLLTFLFISFVSSSQSNKEIIQNYLSTNSAKLGLSKNDVQDWVIQSEGSSASTKNDYCYVVQRYNGIEIFRAVSNFSIKEGKVVDAQKKFISNVSRKVNSLKPTLSALDALSKAYFLLGMTHSGLFSIIEKSGENKFKISKGLAFEEPVIANLVYHQSINENLILAWDLIIDTPKHDHIWSVRIDALNGSMLEKNDFVISCEFDKQNVFSKENEKNTRSIVSFDNSYKQLFSPASSTLLGGAYRVIPFNYESPNHIDSKLILNPENRVASPYGWHDTDGLAGAEYTYTRGNNVWAKEDLIGNNSDSGYSPEGGQLLEFDFLYGGRDVDASSYINASTTNLFYMNNVMHDIWYQYGFTEKNGNFQNNNYGKGGVGLDYVFADAQDGSLSNPKSINNANFSAPVDGKNGRIQMFLWDQSPENRPVTVNSPSIIAGNYPGRQNSFDPGYVGLPTAPDFIQSDLVLFLDSAGQSDGCERPVNSAAMNGKIVILRRGTCSFVLKSKAAQDAGAIAVIVVNDVDGTIGMSGADATIAIPVISMTREIGELIINEMKTQAVNVKLQVQASSFVNTDGDFDNGVIAHEYGHGISTRLAGGANNSNCLNNTDQMGEGWSDWFALMMQIKPGDSGKSKRGIGTFVSNQATDGVGIRSYPYSTDITINPMTYNNTNKFQYTGSDGLEKTSVHGIGSVWATMLWDLTWAYIDKYGYNDNKYTGTGGNNKLMQIVIDGIKMQPCSPTFVSGRDAIIAADQAITGGKDYCMIWEVFAARGLGAVASAGDGNKGNDQVEDFSTPSLAGPNCTLGVSNFDSDDVMKVFPNPSNGLINVRVTQYFGKVDIQVIDVTGRQVYGAKNEDFKSQKSIDLSHLNPGIYILKINGDSLNYVEKIILN